MAITPDRTFPKRQQQARGCYPDQTQPEQVCSQHAPIKNCFFATVLCDSGTQAQMAFEVDVLEAHPSGGSI